MRLHAAELVIREASWRFDNGLPSGEAANTAKYLAAEAAFFACDRAMRGNGLACPLQLPRCVLRTSGDELLPVGVMSDDHNRIGHWRLDIRRILETL